VIDAVQAVDTPIPWFLAAVDRIAALDHCTPEDAFQRVRGEVRELGGFMPGAAS
jgi:hypothetical protein